MKLKMIFLVLTFLLTLTCEERKFNNPVCSDYSWPVPESFNVELISDSQIKLQWEKPDVLSNSAVVQIEKKVDTSQWQLLDNISITTSEYIDNEVQWDKGNSYRVSFLVNEKRSDYSNEITINPSKSIAPSNLQLIKGLDKVDLTWQDNCPFEDSFAIERSKDGSEFGVLQILPANSTSSSDILNELGTFKYRVRAYKDLYYSGYSNEVEAAVTSILPTDGMVAYYPFNGNANDESGNGNDGIEHGVWLATDRFGAYKAFSFAEGAYIDVLLTEKLKITGNITIAVWFNFEGGYYNPRVISLAPDQDGYEIASNGTSSSRSFSFSFGGNGIISNSKLYENNWYFFCGVCDADSIKIYINDKLDNEVAISNKGFNYYTNLNIGRKATSSYDYWGGKIDDIIIYDRALTDQEIKMIYHDRGWE